MNDGLTLWTTKVWPPNARGEGEIPDVALYLGDPADPKVSRIDTWDVPADLLMREHNRQVEWARTTRQAEAAKTNERATIGDVEALLTRVAVATVRELARSLRPRWPRRTGR